MKVVGLVGWHDSGKTTLLVRLLPELIGRGLKVSTMKHSHHGFDVDQPGKDSHRHRTAGATEVLVSSSRRWALMHELRGGAEVSVEALIAHMSPVDLLVIEGFKSHPHDKVEVHRRGNDMPLICRQDPTVVAIASDEPLTGLSIPVLDVDDVGAIADFIVAHCGLAPEPDHGRS